MADRTLNDLADKMADIDFTMLCTHTENGEIAARPMSNNGDVGEHGETHFFALGSTRTVDDIRADPKVTLTFKGSSGILGLRPFMLAVEGTAELIHDHAEFEKHWNSDLERWFPDGIDTVDLVLIRVLPRRVHYWDGEDEGEIVLPRRAA